MSSASQLLPVLGLPPRRAKPSGMMDGTAHFCSLNSRATRSAAEVSVNEGALAPLVFFRCFSHSASAATRGLAASIGPVSGGGRDNDHLALRLAPTRGACFGSLLTGLVGIAGDRQRLNPAEHREGGEVSGATAAPHGGEI